MINPGKKIPVILDTDIGDDIDDTWAIAMMLKSPELDVKLNTTDVGNTTYRTKIIAKMLEIGKRTDIPLGIGLHLKDKLGAQAQWIEGYDLSKYPGKVHEDGVSALIDTIMKSPEQITLICIGPVPNISAALEREPGIEAAIGDYRIVFVGLFVVPATRPHLCIAAEIYANGVYVIIALGIVRV